VSRTILIVAGEASGDAHGAGLVRAARTLDPEVRFVGIGGSGMREAGVGILFDAADIAVVGIFEVLARLPRILHARRVLREALRARRPERVLLIDYPDFNLRFAADAKAAGVVDGQPVVVRTDRGELTGTARVDAAIRRGAVSVPHGHQGANVNLLTSKDTIDPVTGMARYSGIPVSLHPASAA